jgi:DNA segregation ATPase FtsK/SpoIIIE-like protein
LAEDLVHEMERRYSLIDEALCDNLAEYNAENPERAEPYIVTVFDEYAEMVASFADKNDRDTFEGAIGRLAQKARAAGIHLIVCMQRPDANALKGAIKANILHRFALKLPQNHDSRVILDESGAETLLGQGDMLYKDANSRLFRLQVPFLDNPTLKRCLRQLSEVETAQAADGSSSADGSSTKTCPKCGQAGTVSVLFGTRRTKHERKDGSVVMVERHQSYCRACRRGAGK